jgi:hypothetical protein
MFSKTSKRIFRDDVHSLIFKKALKCIENDHSLKLLCKSVLYEMPWYINYEMPWYINNEIFYENLYSTFLVEDEDPQTALLIEIMTDIDLNFKDNLHVEVEAEVKAEVKDSDELPSKNIV